MVSRKVIVTILIVLVVMATLVSCQNEDEKKIVIAEQYGLAYAPLQIMKDQGILDKLLPDYQIEWVKLGNTAAIREAILANKLDVGFLGIPPFLIGFDKGMDWKMFTGLSSAPLGLVSNDPKIKTLDDIGKAQIILPQPGSIQHILLSMAAQKQFGEASKFDQQLVTMKHPDGLNAILSKGDLKLHFTSPPYIFEALSQKDTHLVIDGVTCFGDDFSFIVGMTTGKIANDDTLLEALKLAVEESVSFMATNKEESVEILNNHYDYDRNLLENYIYESGISYTTEIKGVTRFIEFMKGNQYLEGDFNEAQVIW